MFGIRKSGAKAGFFDKGSNTSVSLEMGSLPGCFYYYEKLLLFHTEGTDACTIGPTVSYARANRDD